MPALRPVGNTELTDIESPLLDSVRKGGDHATRGRHHIDRQAIDGEAGASVNECVPRRGRESSPADSASAFSLIFTFAPHVGIEFSLGCAHTWNVPAARQKFGTVILGVPKERNMNAPYRLVSLWDMFAFDGKLLVELASAIGEERVSLAMNRAVGGQYSITTTQLQRIRQCVDGSVDLCAQMELHSTGKAAARILEDLRMFDAMTPASVPIGIAQISGYSVDAHTAELLRIRFRDLSERIRDDLESVKFFHLGEREADLYFSKEPHFGAGVRNQFPSATFEIDEAAKCLAFGRSTASVFHLMRVLEAGIGAIYKCLGIGTLPAGSNPSWGMVLEEIRKELAKRGKAFSENDAFKDMYAWLGAVKDAWRNPTLHFEDKKTEEEAQEILLAVQTFMKKVASRMDENGLPLA